MKTRIDRQAAKNQNSSPFFLARNSDGFFNVQAKYTVGEPGDKYEVEADQMADKVVNQAFACSNGFLAPASSSFVQRRSEVSVQEKPLAESITPFIQKQEDKEEELPVQKQEIKEDEQVQKKPLEEEKEELMPVQKQTLKEDERIQKQAVGDEKKELMPKADIPVMEPNQETENKIKNSEGSGNQMSTEVQTQMESGFGTDFGGVKIHSDQTAVELNKKLGAQAFTVGNDIYFNSDKYQPQTHTGKHLLAHELTHTVQQKGMVQKQVQKTSDFCRPYATAAEAANAKWWLRNTYMRAEGIGTFGTEVYNLYDSYLNRHPGDSLAPRIFNSSSSYIHNCFKDDGNIKDDMDAVINLVYQRIHLMPGGIFSLRPGQRTIMSLSNFLSPSEMNFRDIVFSNPFSVAGHIAGDIGSSDAGPDYRKITYANVAITKVVLIGDTGYYLIELIPHYEVFDTIDFCPGDPGSPTEQLVTTTMSRLEASGEAYDMPFKVVFSPEPRSSRFWF